MASRTETLFGRAAELVPGSDALPGWSIIGVIYWLWFFMHPKFMMIDLSVIAVPVQENAEAITAIATGATYFLGNLLDDWLWPLLKPAWADQYTRRNEREEDRPKKGAGDEFNVLDLLEISEGSYRVATRLLAAAGRDFWPKTLNELAKASRSLAVMALFYTVVPTFGLVNELVDFWWRLVALGLAFLLGGILYPYLKGIQILKYYIRLAKLIAEQKKIALALQKLRPPFTAGRIQQMVNQLKKESLIDDAVLKKHNFDQLPPDIQGLLLNEILRDKLKYHRETTANHQLFFWSGELVTSATRQ